MPEKPVTDIAGPRSPQVETLCRLVADALEVDRINVDDNIFQAGANSVTVVRLVARIRATFGVALGPDTIFRNPTVLSIAERMTLDSQGDHALDALLALRPHGGLPPLFCVHPGGGMSWCYVGLLRSLEPDRPVYGLQARGLKDGEVPAAGGIEEMVEDYLGLVRDTQPRGPFHFLGWSFGGTVAHALASRLQGDGEEVGLLAVMDAEPESLAERSAPTTREILVGLLNEFGYDSRDLATVPLRHDRVTALLRREGSAMAYLQPSHVQSVIDIFANNQRSMRGYEPGAFRGDLQFFSAVADGDQPAVDPSRWTPYVTGEVRRFPIACTHRGIAAPDHMATIATTLNSLMASR